MLKCPRCGCEIRYGNYNFCPWCGAKLKVEFEKAKGKIKEK